MKVVVIVVKVVVVHTQTHIAHKHTPSHDQTHGQNLLRALALAQAHAVVPAHFLILM